VRGAESEAMLSLSVPRKPAPLLALRGGGGRKCVRPTAFGNALGSSIAESMQSAPDQSDAEWQRLKRYEGVAQEQEAADKRTLLNAANQTADREYYRVPPLTDGQYRFFLSSGAGPAGRALDEDGNPIERRAGDPVPGNNHDQVRKGLYEKFQQDVRLGQAIKAREDAAQEAFEKRTGWGGALRGVEGGLRDQVLGPIDLVRSVRENGFLNTAEQWVEGLVNMPSALSDAYENGDTQTLVQTAVGILIGIKGSRGMTAAGQASELRSSTPTALSP
jgi:hypothetical protein